MAKVNAPLLALNRGEVDKLALGRVDIEKLRLAADCQLNFEPKVMGPMGMRPGLQWTGEVAGDNPCQLLDFVYAPDDTAVLELTPNLMRVWIDDVLLTRPQVATAISDPNFAGGGTWSTADTTAGASVTIGGGVLALLAAPLGSLARAKQSVSIASGDQGTEHGLRIAVTNGPVTVRIGSSDGTADILSQAVLDTGTHSLSFTPGFGTIHLQIDSTDQWQKTLSGVAIEAAGAVAVPTPWGASDLRNIRAGQSRDILYVACYGMQQRMIQRRGVRPLARGWSVVLYRSSTGPFHETPDAAITLKPAALFGNTTIAANFNFFTTSHVGALLRLFTPQQNNAADIGASGFFTLPTRISGLQGDRNLTVVVSGTWSGTWSLQRSIEGPDSGFVTIAAGDTGWSSAPTFTANTTGVVYNDDASDPSGVLYDNVIAWYRIGFDSGNYASGSALMQCSSVTGGGWGIARILAYNSPQQVSVEILQTFTGLTAAGDWQISDWCAAFGWPTSNAFHDGRLWWFSGGTIPIAGSQSGEYYDYAEEDRYGNALGDSAAILEDFGEGPSDSINWGVPLTRLLCGREMSIASIRSSSFDEPLTPTNFSVKDCATQGAAKVRALKIDKRGLFVQQSGRRVYALEFDAQAMDYSPHDLTRLNHSVGQPGLVGAAVARQPDTYVYLPRADGQCAVLLFDPDDEVTAWWRIQTLGNIESVCVLPAPDGVDDQVYFVVKRVINGVARRFIEKLAQRVNCLGGPVNQLMDSCLVHLGPASSTISLPHLPLTAVEIWADGVSLGSVDTDASGLATLPGEASAFFISAGLGGAQVDYSGDPVAIMTGLAAYEGLPCEVFADQQPLGHMVHLGAFTVTGGAVTLPQNTASSAIVLFFGYMAPFMSAKLAYGAQAGTPVTMKKKIDHLGMLLYDAGATSLQIGQRFDAMDDLPAMQDGAEVDPDSVFSEFDVPVMEVPGEWDTDARLCLLGQAPFPVTVGGLVIGIKTNG